MGEGDVAGVTLEALMARFRFLSVSCYADYPDGESDEPAADVHIMATDHDGNRKQAVRATVAEAVEAVMGRERKLWCNGPCGLLKPCTEFSHDAGRPTGRCQRCKVCERERVRNYSRKKKGWRGGDEALPPLPRTHNVPPRDQPVILEFPKEQA
jgi:hypothetical protein